MEQLSDEELDHGAEEDSDKEDQDLDKMFGAWLGELDKLTQVREVSISSQKNSLYISHFFQLDAKYLALPLAPRWTVACDQLSTL